MDPIVALRLGQNKRMIESYAAAAENRKLGQQFSGGWVTLCWPTSYRSDCAATKIWDWNPREKRLVQKNQVDTVHSKLEELDKKRNPRSHRIQFSSFDFKQWFVLCKNVFSLSWQFTSALQMQMHTATNLKQSLTGHNFTTPAVFLLRRLLPLSLFPPSIPQVPTLPWVTSSPLGTQLSHHCPQVLDQLPFNLSNVLPLSYLLVLFYVKRSFASSDWNQTQQKRWLYGEFPGSSAFSSFWSLLDWKWFGNFLKIRFCLQ